MRSSNPDTEFKSTPVKLGYSHTQWELAHAVVYGIA